MDEPVCVDVELRLAVALEEPEPVPVDVPERVALGVLVSEGMLRVDGRQGSATPSAANDAGGTDELYSFRPQHVTPPPADSAHEWKSPAARATWPDVATDAGTLS